VVVAEPEVEPVVAADEPGLVTVGDEPLQAEELPTLIPPKPEKKAPAKKKAAAKKAPAKKKLPPWVDPDGNVCPKTHPIKGKLSSKIFQAPGNFAYDRTNPDRCYESAASAEKDGLRPAKR
jgi:micrococcal nuclease